MTDAPFQMIRLPGGDLGTRIGATTVRIVPSHADRRRLRYWRAQELTGEPLTRWVSTPQVAAALWAAQIAVAAVGRG